MAGLFKAMFNRGHSAYSNNATVTAYLASGNKDASTSLIAAENGKSDVVLSSTMGPTDVLDAVAEAVNAAQPGTLLPCDVIISGDDVTLDFSATDASREKAFKSGNLFSGHHAILTANGVERAWGCVAVKKGTKLAEVTLPSQTVEFLRAIVLLAMSLVSLQVQNLKMGQSKITET